jgi:hypothetical protein
MYVYCRGDKTCYRNELININICIRVYVYTHVYKHVYIYTCNYTYRFVYLYICMYTNKCIIIPVECRLYFAVYVMIHRWLKPSRLKYLPITNKYIYISSLYINAFTNICICLHINMHTYIQRYMYAYVLMHLILF